MKKLISILTVFAMILAFAAIPAMAEDVTVDFTDATNVAYQKTITPKAGRDYYVTARGLTKPSAISQLGTDGDLTTYHAASGRDQITWATATGNVGVEFSMDFGAKKKVNSIDLYVQPTIYDSTQDRAQNDLSIKVYGGNSVDSTKLIGTMTKPTGLTSVTAGGNTMDMYIYHIDFPADSVYSAITFESSAWYFGYNEIYVNGETYVDPGTDVDFVTDNILAGKKVTHIKGYYYESSTPSDTKQYATDGDITTIHSGYGVVSGQTTGVAFSVDIEGRYLLDTFDIYLHANSPGRRFNLYTGTKVDEANLIGTYITDSDTTKINAGGYSANLSVGHFELPDNIVADHLTVYYPDGWGFAYVEIAATGTAVGDDYIAVDFTKSLAYKKDNAMVIGHYYDDWSPALNDKATDGDITTTHGVTGAYSGGESGYYGTAFRVDLGAYYKLSEITLYTKTKASSKLQFCSENGYTVSSVGNATNKGGYIYNSQGGIVQNGFAEATRATETSNINGTAVYANTATIPADAEPVRYLIVFMRSGSWEYSELYVAGTPFTGELAFAEADFGYAEDEGTKTVAAKVALMNTTGAATSGKIYYAAYDADGALVGFTTAAIDNLAAGATYNTPVTFTVSDEATAVKAFYWSNNEKFVPIIGAINAN